MRGQRSAAGDAIRAGQEKGRPGEGPAADARRAVFLDRDGTLVRETHYLADPSRLALLPRAGQAVAKLQAAGFAVVLVTNQSGIARGLSTEDDLAAIHAKLGRRLARHRACLDGIYVCPHHPDGTVEPYRTICLCRKPGIGLFHQARDELGLQLTGSYHIGDKRSDVEAAARAGLVSILVLSGYGRQEWEACLSDRDPSSPMPDCVAKGLAEAAEWVLWREFGKEPIRWSSLWLSPRLLPLEAARWRRAGRRILVLVDRPSRLLARPPQPPADNLLGQWVIAALDLGPAAGDLRGGQAGRWIARRIDWLSRVTGVNAVTWVAQTSELHSLLESIRPDAVCSPSKGGQT